MMSMWRVTGVSGITQGLEQDEVTYCRVKMTPEYSIEEVTREGDIKANVILISTKKRSGFKKKGQQTKDPEEGEAANTSEENEVRRQPDSMKDFLWYIFPFVDALHAMLIYTLEFVLGLHVHNITAPTQK